MMTHAEKIAAEFTHAVFERIHPRAELAPVPLAEASAFYLASYARGECVRLTKVARDAAGRDWSWGKAWFATEHHDRVKAGEMEEGAIARIGAGAYGDLTVWEAR